jgi:uncharacterized membrane protein YoaK (UPF0700 family)
MRSKPRLILRAVNASSTALPGHCRAAAPSRRFAAGVVVSGLLAQAFGPAAVLAVLAALAVGAAGLAAGLFEVQE